MNKTIFLFIALFTLAGCELSVYEGNIPEGTFKAMIGNETVFTNGPDIIDVDTTLESGVMEELCEPIDEGFNCPFTLGIKISKEAAKRQAEITSELNIINGSLSKPMTVYLREEKLDEIKISEELKGEKIQDIIIVGSGEGETKEEAIANSEAKHDELFDILLDIK